MLPSMPALGEQQQGYSLYNGKFGTKPKYQPVFSI